MIVKKRCKYVNSKKFSELKIEKKYERNTGQPLFVKPQSTGS